jgi:hypothetical protein
MFIIALLAIAAVTNAPIDALLVGVVVMTVVNAVFSLLVNVDDHGFDNLLPRDSRINPF